MSLADGDPAPAVDTWSRIITNAKHWRKDGKVHNKAFTGSAISPPDQARPWSHELSGRLLSLIGDLRVESEGFCAAFKKTFEGLVYQEVANLRGSISDVIQRDVRYTPLDRDNAHSDFVTIGSTDANLAEVRDWLQDNLLAVRPADVAAIECLRVGPDEGPDSRGTSEKSTRS
jgi:hypothetical protein